MNSNFQKILLSFGIVTFLLFSLSNASGLSSDEQASESSSLPTPNLIDPNRFTSEHEIPPSELEKIPPKKQISLGIEPAAVKCKQGLYLVLKYGDDTPACVKQSTAAILYERGWGAEPHLAARNNFSINSIGSFFA